MWRGASRDGGNYNFREGRSPASGSGEYMAARSAESRGGEDLARGNSSGASLSGEFVPGAKRKTGKGGLSEGFVIEADLEIKERKGGGSRRRHNCLKAKVRAGNGGKRERIKGLEKLFDLGCLWRRNE